MKTPEKCSDCQFLTKSKFEKYPGACSVMPYVNDIISTGEIPVNCPIKIENNAVKERRNRRGTRISPVHH